MNQDVTKPDPDDPMTGGPTPAPTRPRRRALLRRTALGAVLLIGGGVGVAWAMGGPFPGPFGYRDPGQRLERLQSLSRRALDAVGATSEQENRIHDIIASAFAAVAKEAKPDEELRRRLVDLLKAPSVDRAAVETLRADIVRSVDARSKIVAGALVDAAGQLGAEQRAQLADRATAMMERRRGGGWGGRRRPDDGPDRMPGGSGAPSPDRN